MPGTLYLVSTPIGNLGDMTLRAIEVLGSVGTVLAEDTRRTRVLLEHYGIPVDSLRSYHEHNEAARTAEMREALADGANVALVSDSGTPLISDPGLRLVQAAHEVGARVVPIPGASALLGALVGSGLDPQPFTFYGFVPRVGRERVELLAGLERLSHTAVLYESAQRLVRTLEWLADGLGGGRQAVVARELTKIHEELVSGTLTELAAHYRAERPRGEVVICLAGARPAARHDEEEIRAVAFELAAGGARTREIVGALRDRFGLDRNRAYEIALESGEERTER